MSYWRIRDFLRAYWSGNALLRKNHKNVHKNNQRRILQGEYLEPRLVLASGSPIAITADISAGAASSSPNNIVNFNNVALFAANNGTQGIELWRSDGTSTGTFLVADIAQDQPLPLRPI